MQAPPPILGDAVLPPELLRTAHGAARELAARGIGAGSRIAVESADVLPWFLGADLLGAATLVVKPAWTPVERRAVLADARPDVTVTGSPPASHAEVEPAGDGRTAFYLPTTSGSSGTPKVMIRNRDSWLRTFPVFPLPGDGPVLVPGPLSSSLFLFGAVHAMASGRTPVVLHRWRPAEAARACRTATAVHLVPAMLAALLDELAADPALRAQCTLRVVVCAGARVGPAQRERLAALLPGCELIEYYGSAEHSLIAVRRGDDGLRPVAGVEVDVRDGLVWVRSPLVFSGYLRGGELSAAPDEWSTVDDMGELRPDGTLQLRGRAGSAIVSSGGKLVSAEEVEAPLRDVAGVVEIVVTGTPHPTFGAIVTAVVEIDTGAPPALRALRGAARNALEPGKRPRRWIAVKALPRTASGKPARATTAEQLHDGSLLVEPWL